MQVVFEWTDMADPMIVSEVSTLILSVAASAERIYRTWRTRDEVRKEFAEYASRHRFCVL